MLKIFEFNLKYRCLSELAKTYINELQLHYLKKREQLIPIFYSEKFNDLHSLF